MTIEGGISISEKPVFRLAHTADDQPIRARIENTERRSFVPGFPAVGG